MNLSESQNEISTWLNNETFVISTVKQINKDLGGLEADIVNFDLDFESDVLLQLTNQLSQVLLKMSSINIQQFIYRVDLNEAQYLQAVSKEDDFKQLAYLIIRREAQKVYLRSKFK